MTTISRQVPFLDLATVHRELSAEILSSIEASLHSARFVGGPEVDAFESEFAAHVEAPFAVGVASGTDALRLAYRALGLEPGDEVVTVPNTFIATTATLTQAGGTIRLVDVDPRTSNMDVEQLEAGVGPRTVGIVPVHLYGQPADIDAVRDVAERRGLWVVEDAAQAQGSRYRGRRIGNGARLATFSFYPGKNLGACGEAGAVTSTDADLVKRMRVLRDHGQSEKYYHKFEGYNARLDAWQAAVLRIKLRHLDAWNASRRQVASWYREVLADIDEVALPYEPDWAEGNYHIFCIHADRRDELRAHLEQCGVSTGMHYPLPLHLQEAYARLGLKRGSFPVTERLADRLLSLPIFPGLSRDDVEYVGDQVRTFYGPA